MRGTPKITIFFFFFYSQNDGAENMGGRGREGNPQHLINGSSLCWEKPRGQDTEPRILLLWAQVPVPALGTLSPEEASCPGCPEGLAWPPASHLPRPLPGLCSPARRTCLGPQFPQVAGHVRCCSFSPQSCLRAEASDILE